VGEDRTGRPGPTNQRVTVSKAAEQLGITAEAVRMRIKRGTLRSKRQAGRVFVLLGPDRPTEYTTERTEPTEDRTAELIATLQEQLAEEREARRRADTIIAQLARANAEQARTIRELEAPADTPPPPDPARSAQGGGHTATDEESGQGRPLTRILLTYVVGVLLVCGAGAFDSVMYEDPAFGGLVRTVPLALLSAWVFGAYAGFVDGRAVWFSKWFPYVAVITAIAATAAISYGSVLENNATFAEWIKPRNLFAKGVALAGTWLMCRFGALVSKTALLPWTSDQGQIERRKALLGVAGTIVVPIVSALLSELQKASGH
jgi:hypothetical protein